MKNNKKGFIAITIIYSFFILFVTVMLLIMYSYINDRKMNNKIKSDLINNLRNKAPDITISMNGSTIPQSSFDVSINILDGGNGIASAKYIWSVTPLADPNIDMTSYSQTVTSPTEAGYYFLIIKACDANSTCKTAISNSFRVGAPLLCLRAKNLHNEICSNSNEDGYCRSYGMSDGGTIVYGNFGVNFKSEVGDAYDCDVNGDGTYDPVTERFYYLSDYYDTISGSYDSNYATLVYYTNVKNGSANNAYTTAYNSGSDLLPETSYSELPSTSSWTNSALRDVERNIFSTTGVDKFSSEYDYTGTVQEFKAYFPGQYRVQLWGAQGGSYNETEGGKGAYTDGTITLAKGDILYVYVGGTTTDRNPGYNGGGRGGTTGDGYNTGGGGATDVRLLSGDGAWDDEASLKSRIMVAAGGSGVSCYSGCVSGGAGGSLYGYQGSSTGSGAAHELATGGTQISAGYGINASGPISGFGFSTQTGEYGSGGGGGYWGGGSGGATSRRVSSGAGGSSFISGQRGCVAISSSESLDPIEGCGSINIDYECSVHYSGKVFTNNEMIDGEDNMPNYEGTGLILGNSGNGHAKITFMGPYADESGTNRFTYSDKAARILSFKELRNCLDLTSITGEDQIEYKINNKCSFLLENTKFTHSNRSEGYFTENPYLTDGNIWTIDAGKTGVYSGIDKTTSNKYGVRPVIDVNKLRMEI